MHLVVFFLQVKTNINVYTVDNTPLLFKPEHINF